MDRICYLIPNRSTYEGDPIGNLTFPVSNRSRVNRVDPYHSESDPKRILTYPIPWKRSLSIVWSGPETSTGCLKNVSHV